MNKTINQLMEIVTELCKKEGISFFAKFKPTLDGNEESFYSNGGFVFSASDIFTMIQLWEAKHKTSLIKDQNNEVVLTQKDTEGLLKAINLARDFFNKVGLSEKANEEIIQNITINVEGYEKSPEKLAEMITKALKKKGNN